MGKYFIAPGSLEKVTKDKIKMFFNDNGIWNYMPTPSGLTGTGISDHAALHKGLFIAIEAKRNTPASKATPHQLKYIDRVNACGGFAMIVKCEEDIMKLDEELKLRGII